MWLHPGGPDALSRPRSQSHLGAVGLHAHPRLLRAETHLPAAVPAAAQERAQAAVQAGEAHLHAPIHQDEQLCQPGISHTQAAISGHTTGKLPGH